jgi:hypothetical protein
MAASRRSRSDWVAAAEAAMLVGTPCAARKNRHTDHAAHGARCRIHFVCGVVLVEHLNDLARFWEKNIERRPSRGAAAVNSQGRKPLGRRTNPGVQAPEGRQKSDAGPLSPFRGCAVLPGSRRSVQYKGATGSCLGQKAKVTAGFAGVFGPKAQPISQARAALQWHFPGRK